MKNHKIFISKKDFVTFRICPKLMWIMYWRKDLQVFQWCQKNLFFLNKDYQKKFFSFFKYQKGIKATNSLEYYAISGIMFENYIIKFWSDKKNFCNLEKYFVKKTKIQKTQITRKLLEDQKYQIYFQPYFMYQNFITKCDLLIKKSNFHFDLYEIKAVNKLKKEFKDDLMYQCWILKKLGYQIDNVYILHCNDKYRLQKELNIKKLMKISSFYNLPEIKNPQSDAFFFACQKYLEQKFEILKETLSSPFCDQVLKDDCRNYQKTNLKYYCQHLISKPLPKYSWLEFYRMRTKKKIMMYASNQFIPLDLCNFKNNHFSLTKTQKRMLNVLKTWKNQENYETKIFNDLHKTRQQLFEYQFPLYFYDFETTAFAIPKFKNSSPWMQIPFQFSFHVLLNENYDLKNKQNILHFSYIVKNSHDSRLKFITKFLQIFDKFGKGKGVVYNKSFEKMILNNLIDTLDLNLQQISKIQDIINRTLDLKDFFNDFNIYHPKFHGSLSIKKVLPALFQKFSYQDLKIKSGDQASIFYFNYLCNFTSQEQWNNDSLMLEKYCERDTFAMVLIFDKIRKKLKKTFFKN